MMPCVHCGEGEPTAFYASALADHHYVCAECMGMIAARRRVTDEGRAKHRAAMAAWTAANHEHRLELNRASAKRVRDRQRQEREANPPPPKVRVLRCPHCETTDPGRFTPSARARGGGQTCNECGGTRLAIWRADHRDRVNAAQRTREAAKRADPRVPAAMARLASAATKIHEMLDSAG